MAYSRKYGHTSSAMGSAYITDLKAVVRKALTDQSVYASFLIIDSIPRTNQNAVNATTTRLLKNPKDIGALLETIIGKELAYEIESAFTQHLKLAAAMLLNVVSGDNDALQADIQRFLDQGNDVAYFLSEINSTMLPYDAVADAILVHNNYIVDLAVARAKQDYTLFSNIYDKYYEQILGVADLLYNALHMAPM